MKYFDIKDRPTTRLEYWNRWCNYTVARCMSRVGKKIKLTTKIDVIVVKSEQDWEFEQFNNYDGKGTTRMLLF
jgi:hypothetical protein